MAVAESRIVAARSARCKRQPRRWLWDSGHGGADSFRTATTFARAFSKAGEGRKISPVTSVTARHEGQRGPVSEASPYLEDIRGFIRNHPSEKSREPPAARVPTTAAMRKTASVSSIAWRTSRPRLAPSASLDGPLAAYVSDRPSSRLATLEQAQ